MNPISASLGNPRTSESSQGETTAAQLLRSRYRLACELPGFEIAHAQSVNDGYFLFDGLICYGKCAGVTPAGSADRAALPTAKDGGLPTELAFDPVQILDNYRCERYYGGSHGGVATRQGLSKRLYYLMRPLLPVGVRKYLQQYHLRGWEKAPFPAWPIDASVEAVYERLLARAMRAAKVDRVPFIWFWPEGAPSCAVVTHDVETQTGLDACGALMDLDASYGIRSSFQLIPEKRYSATEPELEQFRKRGFEINIHDLNHDGKLFWDKAEFLRRAAKINSYVEKYKASGFRSAVMYRNMDWLNEIKVSYDMSSPNSAHLDPQKGGCCTVLPFFAGETVILPTTTTQDYSLFHIFNEYSITRWQAQMETLRKMHGLMNFIVHPDYILEPGPRGVYSQLLAHIADFARQGNTWLALPREVADWWRLRSQLRLVQGEDGCRIEGQGNERARIAHAVVDATGRLSYEMEGKKI